MTGERHQLAGRLFDEQVLRHERGSYTRSSVSKFDPVQSTVPWTVDVSVSTPLPGRYGSDCQVVAERQRFDRALDRCIARLGAFAS